MESRYFADQIKDFPPEGFPKTARKTVEEVTDLCASKKAGTLGALEDPPDRLLAAGPHETLDLVELVPDPGASGDLSAKRLGGMSRPDRNGTSGVS